ncbi:hypothetical protein L0664_08465 [Octadecabacter sp. G9-8]|uniref:Lipoprotein n=1 Tax=Octadecabacter dasysiphoniae TaxID=2909341 RepID=A0ABS9CVL9_9RHOB|nr:hypothetical protein [Octadecabacter dasysiphoniae]MCF2871097.1 hypothetical protein [Octadecabacter dasysiphoniae]
MKIILITLPLLALAACSTPREQCISTANSQLRTLDRLVNVTRGNVQRGFALTSVQDVRVVQSTCQGRNEDGTEFRFDCEETQTRTRQEPVTIDIAEERRKLAQLEERRDQAARDAVEQTQQCIAMHPE